MSTAYWVNKNGGLWTDINNWSTSSGGTTRPGSVPNTSSDTAFFDNNSVETNGSTIISLAGNVLLKQMNVSTSNKFTLTTNSASNTVYSISLYTANTTDLTQAFNIIATGLHIDQRPVSIQIVNNNTTTGNITIPNTTIAVWGPDKLKSLKEYYLNNASGTGVINIVVNTDLNLKYTNVKFPATGACRINVNGTRTFRVGGWQIASTGTTMPSGAPAIMELYNYSFYGNTDNCLFVLRNYDSNWNTTQLYFYDISSRNMNFNMLQGTGPGTGNNRRLGALHYIRDAANTATSGMRFLNYSTASVPTLLIDTLTFNNANIDGTKPNIDLNTSGINIEVASYFSADNVRISGYTDLPATINFQTGDSYSANYVNVKNLTLLPVSSTLTCFDSFDEGGNTSNIIFKESGGTSVQVDVFSTFDTLSASVIAARKFRQLVTSNFGNISTNATEISLAHRIVDALVNEINTSVTSTSYHPGGIEVEVDVTATFGDITTSATRTIKFIGNRIVNSEVGLILTDAELSVQKLKRVYSDFDNITTSVTYQTSAKREYEVNAEFDDVFVSSTAKARAPRLIPRNITINIIEAPVRIIEVGNTTSAN